jgi:hypothetical protein
MRPPASRRLSPSCLLLPPSYPRANMLNIVDPRPNHTCQGFSRREFLRVGGLGLLGGLTLPGLLEARAESVPGYGSGSLVTGKAVVLLFLQGGPSHIECFDPKMSAPENVRSCTGEVKTVLPGVTFGGTFPKLAGLADKLTVVRNYGSKNNDHSYLAVTSGGNPLKAAMSALYTRVAGPMNAKTGVPTNVLVLPEAVQPGLKLGSNFETGALPTLTTPGDLGRSFGAVDPSGGADFKRLMELQVDPARFDDRKQLLAQVDSLRRRLDDVADGNDSNLGGFDHFQQQAYDLVLRGIADAFDLSKEDLKTIERYDTSQLFRLEDVTKWFDMKRATNLLGKQMLLARRLCEAGAGFVTVSDCGWDMHSNSNSPKNLEGIKPLGGQVDHAVSAFLEDVHERGLSDKILLVVTGEMGRTPRRNKDGGRDHYGNLTPLLIAGGGLKMGQVIGESDRNAAMPAADPQTPANLLATVMRTVLDVQAIRTTTNLGKTAAIVSNGEPIPGLLPA